MLHDILENIEYTDKNIWLTTRIQSLMYLQPWASKRLKERDLFELPWDIEREQRKQDAAAEYIKNNITSLEKFINNPNG